MELMDAIEYGTLNDVRTLLQHGYDPHEDVDDYFPLELAISLGDIPIITLLLSYSDYLDGRYLVQAMVADRYDIVELLLGKVDIDAPDQYGYTALHQAYLRYDQEGVDFLIDRGANQHTKPLE